MFEKVCSFVFFFWPEEGWGNKKLASITKLIIEEKKYRSNNNKVIEAERKGRKSNEKNQNIISLKAKLCVCFYGEILFDSQLKKIRRN